MRAAGIIAFICSLWLSKAVLGQDVEDRLLRSVVTVKSEVPPGARTARSLGPERVGSGVVIDSSGLILTIGYLIVEAMTVQVVGASGKAVSADFVGYDHSTGFGLVRAREPFRTTPIDLGSARQLEPGAQVLIASRGPSGAVVRPAYVVSRREFAGYWEYLLENALFTSPPHPDFGGAALLDDAGHLVGIGSLQVPNAVPERPLPGNMFVPIDLLKPVLAELMLDGRPKANDTPWLGAHLEELGGRVLVRRVSKGGPAASAGVQAGDLIAGVAGKPVSGLADFYRSVWALGPPGTTITLNILRGLEVEEVPVVSGDRYDYLQLKPSY